MLGLVVLESVQEERGGLLDHVGSHEDVDDLKASDETIEVSSSRSRGKKEDATNPLDVDQRSALVVDERSSELGSLLRVNPSDVLEERRVIRGVSDLLRVENLQEGKESDQLSLLWRRRRKYKDVRSWQTARFQRSMQRPC